MRAPRRARGPRACRARALSCDMSLPHREIFRRFFENQTTTTGVGNASSGGTPASVGHSYARLATPKRTKARRLNMGCKARGQPGQPFSHKTGHGYVKAHRGFYHDAIIFVKRNNFNLLLHETFGGGFSPTAVLKLRRLARKVARGSVDRTAYSPKYSLSFMSHHAERRTSRGSGKASCVRPRDVVEGHNARKVVCPRAAHRELIMLSLIHI